jgi:hypothetical protein
LNFLQSSLATEQTRNEQLRRQLEDIRRSVADMRVQAVQQSNADPNGPARLVASALAEQAPKILDGVAGLLMSAVANGGGNGNGQS